MKMEICYEGQIPKDDYSMTFEYAENGFIVSLIGAAFEVKFDFGNFSAMRVFDEGIVLNDSIFGGELDSKFQEDKFSNAIYRIYEGEFDTIVRKTSTSLYDFLELKHYVIFSIDFIIEVITPWEPEIIVAPCLDEED